MTIEFRLCKICQETKPIGKFTQRRKRKDGTYNRRWTCTACRSKLAATRNPEGTKKHQRDWYARADKQKIRQYNKRGADNLTDWYVKSLIAKRSNLKHSDIPIALVNIHRLNLKIKRFLKEANEKR